MPYDKKPGSVTRMYSEKGKPAGLMLEGSVAQMGSPYKKVEPKPFKDPGAPEGFKADAPGVTGTVKSLSTKQGGGIVDLEKGERVSGQDLYKVRKIEEAKQGYGEQLTKEDKRNVAQKRLTSKKLSATDVAKGLGLSPKITTVKYDG